jgi:hypothetical protein
MTRALTRRAALGAAGAVSLGVLADVLTADDSKPTVAQAATFVGTWTYRSFLSNPDIDVDFNKLEFARATLLIEKAPFGVLRGKLSFGDDYLALKGRISYGNPFTARFQGKGATAGTKGWIYDYLGYLVPMWPDGVDQRPAIVGTVIRTVPHSEGKAKAGVVASFIAVLRDPR